MILIVEGNGYSLNGNNAKIRFTFRGKNNITFKNLTVKNFQRYDVYGGFYLGQGPANLFIDNVTFDNISTDDASEIYGGVINVTDNSELSVVNSVFQNNHQYKSSGRGDNPLGGVIHIQGKIKNWHADGISELTKLENTKFINNSVKSLILSSIGGAVAIEGGAGTINNVYFEKNVAETLGENSSALGGAMSFGGDDSSRGISTVDSFTNVTFVQNSALASGNNAQAKGGALYLFKHGTIDIKGAEFTGNAAVAVNGTAQGGAVFNDSGAISVNGFSLSSAVLKNNSVSGLIAQGGAVYNNDEAIAGTVNADFIGNYAHATTAEAYGGAVYNASDVANSIFLNSNFVDNYAKSESGRAQGGAIFSHSAVKIVANGADSLFSGNYVETNGVKASNAVYMSNSDLSLLSVNGGNILFKDGIDGVNYNIVLNGDGSGEILFDNKVQNVSNLTIENTPIIHLGTGAEISAANMRANSTILKIDVETNKDTNIAKTGIIKLSGDVSGNYNVIVNALNPDGFNGASSIFLTAPNDDTGTASSFSVARVIGSPYMWQTSLNLNGETSGSTWYINLPKGEDKDDDVTPEVIAGIGLHEAAIEQTRSVVRNVSGKVASGREYCPGCGIYPTSWDSKALRNVWVMAQGESANIDKPADMDAKIWGAEGGFDLQNDVNNTLGVFASYRKGEYDLSGKGSKYYSKLGSEIDIDSYLAGLYYRYDKNMNWLFATVYGGVQQADAKTDDGMSKFDSDGVELGAGLEAGHSFALNKSLTLDPSLGVYYTQISFDKAHDNVGKSYKWDDIKHVEAEAAVKLSQQFENAKVYVKPSLIQTYTDGDSVKISGLNKADTYHDQTLGRIEIGGNYGFTDSLNGYVWSNYTYGSSYDSIAAGLGINYAW